MKNKPKENTKQENKKELKMEEKKMSEKNIGMKKENNNKTHISFAECFPNDWREYFGKKEVIMKIIQDAGFEKTHDFVKLITTYLIDGNRLALIVLLRRKGAEILDKLIIDVISGYIEFEQLMDVLYIIGSDADYRIILYDNNAQDCGRHSITGIMLTSIMKETAGCVSLTVMGVDLEIGDENVVDFQCVDMQAIIKDEDGKLPGRDSLNKVEFWISYFLPACSQDACSNYGSLFSGEDDEIEDRIDWDEDRMIMTRLISKKDLRWLLTNKLEEMKAFFKGCTIDLEIQAWRRTTDKMHKEHVALCDALDKLDDEKYELVRGIMTICRPIPFRNFIYSLPSEKESLAEQFASMSSYLEGLIRDRKDKEKSYSNQ